MDHDEEKKESGVEEKKVSDVEALKKCLEKNKGDNAKCKSLLEAFKSEQRFRNRGPLRIRPGSWTDV
ncbi:putative prolyl 4-hydroxylase alpha subunit [Capsicum annuum]|uniref:Uncharacterized protein n=1 Tax=Capsicum annuum TaxID=4072 RepID=A0A2G2YXP2_CAPAN|nr:putative prolyl 4-hydroxylase alpha subunit [Capsicum annuum]KAF3675860.1 putative prolyl 4-hydroxylase alpha subunit [Capsicum annuum]PHT74527.1 hypothetical protein T459_21804 [Capsicum annuum]